MLRVVALGTHLEHLPRLVFMMKFDVGSNFETFSLFLITKPQCPLG